MTTPPHPDDRKVAHGSTVGTMAYILAGPLVWALHFTVLYAVQSSACVLAATGRLASTSPWVGTTIVVATLIACAILLAAMAAPVRFRRLTRSDAWALETLRFQTGVMRVLAALSLFAVVAAALTLLMLPTCLPLR